VRQRCSDGVVPFGPVDNLAEVFDRVRLTVAPLRFGPGIKGKVINSLAAGLPCVMTPVGAEGLALCGALAACIATTTDEIAATIARLHNDKIANAQACAVGLNYIAETFSEGQLDAAMQQVLGRANSPLAQAALADEKRH
jgi:glycosyltransferase involved in cell wall biosynthesis